MPRSHVCRPAAAFTRPTALESPFKGEFTPKDWFRFENSADDADTTHIYIYDVIGGWFGTSADEMLYQLKNVETPTITLHINSPGGDVFDGVAIYNALRAHDAQVNVIVDALAASAASFIAQAGDTVTMNTGSMMMIHDASAGSYENADGHRQTGTILDKVSDSVAGIYAARAGGDDKTWRKTMKAEAWYSAQEAVDAGLADAVSEKQAEENPTDRFDLSIFNYAGRGKAPSPVAIMNQAKKETPVAKPSVIVKPKAEETDEEKAAREAAEAAAADTETGDDPDETDEEKAAREAAEAAGEAEDKGGTKPTNVLPAGVFMCDGQRVTDAKAVQAHIDQLEGFQRDQTVANRTSFVEQLAHDKKISATQIEKLTAYAKDLTAAQFTAWSGTWDAAPANPAFAQHGGGTTNHEGEATEKSALDQKIETAKAIVARHRGSGMKEEKIKLTDSYKLLEANNAL